MAFNDLGTVKPGTTLYIPFHTFDSNDPSASVTISGLAVGDIQIYKDGGTTQRASTAGFALLDTDGIDFDTTTGVHGISIDLADNTTAGFYEAGSQYWVVISSITVDAATVNFVLATFKIGYEGAILDTTIATLASQTGFTLEEGPADNDALNGCRVVVHDLASAVQIAQGIVSDYVGSTRTVTLAADPGIFTMAAGDNVSFFPQALIPTTAGATLDVTSTGAAGIDWGNVENPTTAVDLSGTDIQLCDTVTTNTDMRGTDNAALASVLGALADAAAAGDPTSADTVMQYLKQIVNTLEGTAGIPTFPAEAAPGNNVSLAEIIRAIHTDVTGLNGDAMRGTDGASTLTAAQVNAEVDTALADVNLDHLVGTAAPGNAPAGTYLDILADDGTATYDRTTDSLQAIRDRGDAAWTTGGGGSDPSLLQNTTIATLASQTSFTLTAGSADDDAYNGAIAVVTDSATSTQKAVGLISDYTGSTRTVTLAEDPGIFTMAVGDTIDIIAAPKQLPDAVHGANGGLPTGDANNRVDVGSWLGNAVTASSGNPDVNVESMDADVITSTVIANDAIGATEIATGAIDADAIATDAITADKIAADAIGASEIAADAIGASELAADAVAEIADGVWDEAKSGHTTQGTYGENFVQMISASAVTGTLSTTQMTTDLTETTDDHYNGRTIVWTTGNLAGQATDITDYTGSTKLLTFTAVTEAPANGDDFIIF